MRRWMVLMLLAMVTTGLACAENKPSAGTGGTDAGKAPAGETLTKATADSPSGATAVDDKSAHDDPGMPVPPADAQWTIYCQTYASPDHVLIAKAMRDQLRRRDRSMPDWYVVHGEGESTLYYGFYRVISETSDPKDAKEATRFQRDRKTIDRMTDASGNRPFRYCHGVPFGGPDPSGPPEWNLVNAKGYWSVEIASYTGSPLRKQYALDAVREARAQGVEAYYYHGPNASSVCVGVWPEQAVRKPEEARSTNSTDPLLVLPGGIPQEMPQELKTPDGQRIQTVGSAATIEDPTVLAVMKQYPHHVLNGDLVPIKGKDARTRQVKQEFEPSYLVPIPQQEASILSGDAPPADLVIPPPSSSSGGGTPAGTGGRLKSIGG